MENATRTPCGSAVARRPATPSARGGFRGVTQRARCRGERAGIRSARGPEPGGISGILIAVAKSIQSGPWRGRVGENWGRAIARMSFPSAGAGGGRVEAFGAVNDAVEVRCACSLAPCANAIFTASPCSLSTRSCSLQVSYTLAEGLTLLLLPGPLAGGPAALSENDGGGRGCGVMALPHAGLGEPHGARAPAVRQVAVVVFKKDQRYAIPIPNNSLFSCAAGLRRGILPCTRVAPPRPA